MAARLKVAARSALFIHGCPSHPSMEISLGACQWSSQDMWLAGAWACSRCLEM